jgi:PAS domain S-box-containing protein
MPIESPPGGHPDNKNTGDLLDDLKSPELAPYWLTAIIDSADDAIISKTLEGIITSWNKGAQRIFGYTAEEVIGKPVTILIPPDHLDEEPTILARIRNGERIEHYETVRVRKDGTLVDISLTVSPIRTPEGRIIGASKIARDISDRRLAEAALGAQAEVIKQAYDAIFLRDSTNAITLWNKGAERTYGYTQEEALGRSPHELLKTEPPVSLEEIYESLRSEGYWEGELKHTRKDAEQIIVETRWATVLDDRGKISTILEITRDVTERKQSEEKLLQAAAIVENSDDAIISKDLNGIILSWNPGAERIYGYTAAETIGQSVTMLIPPDRPDEEPRILGHIRRGERVDHYETQRRRKDGRIIDVSLTVSPVKDTQGQIIGASKIARDITERKRAERESVERARLLSLGVDVGVALTQRDSLPEMLHACAEALVRHLDAAFARVWTLREEEQVLELRASAGLYTHLDGPHSRVRVGEYKIGLIAEERAPHMTNDVPHDPRVSDHEWAEREGMVAFAGYPLIVAERLVGVMALFARQPLNDATLQAMSSVADSIALGIERKRAEEELREQADVIETVNHVGQMIAAELDQHKLVQAVTDAATEITGAHFGSFFYNVLDDKGASYMLYTLSGVPRSAFEHFPMPRATDLFGPTFRGEDTILITDVKKDPRYGNNSPYYGMPEGHLPVTSYLAVPVISRSGEVYGGLFFGHPEAGVFTERMARIVEGLAAQAAVAMDNARLFDAVERARAEAETAAAEKERLYRQAQESSRLKDEFLATVSHELRTPLTAILGWAHMLRSEQISKDSASKALETIERSARAQGQLIEDLLDVSRIITGKLRIDMRPLDPNSFIEAAIEAVRPAAEAKDVRVQKIMDTGSVTVTGDPVRLQQVVWNLLSNAIKFTPRGGRVQVRLERVNSHVEIAVSDTGAGVAPEFLPYVFDRFRQADQRTTRQHGGMGLGLSIVRHLVELHGGTVRAESAGLGEGSTFTVLLPVAPVYQTETAGERVHPAARDTLPSYECAERLDGIRILVVDDEPDTRELLKAGLGQCGAEVSLTASASEALAAIELATPALIISDIGMPDVDGYELMKQIRSLPADKGGKIPAIALTAYARTEDRLQALRAGYQMHVTKPVELAELVAVASSLVQRGS